MSNKNAKSGTGYEFCRIDLGPIGDLVIEDDGGTDIYVNTIIETQSSRSDIKMRLCEYRKQHGDAALEAALQDGRTQHVSGRFHPRSSGIFVCRDCHTSWPEKDNQTPNRSFDTCPDCF